MNSQNHIRHIPLTTAMTATNLISPVQTIAATGIAPPHIAIRRANERGIGDHGWLNSRFTFSFADYHDPRHMGFRDLRVINDDRVAPGGGFDMHPHRDMEIFSYILHGTLEHKDSMGNGRQLKRGEIQLMSAGSGISHSEFNPSHTQELHFLQIWIKPRQRGIEPRYTEWRPSTGQSNAQKVLVISPDGREGSAIIAQDAEIHRIKLKPGETVSHDLAAGRAAWLHVAEGSIKLNGLDLGAGDGASTEKSGLLTLKALEATEALLFDLP